MRVVVWRDVEWGSCSEFPTPAERRAVRARRLHLVRTRSSWVSFPSRHSPLPLRPRGWTRTDSASSSPVTLAGTRRTGVCSSSVSSPMDPPFPSCSPHGLMRTAVSYSPVADGSGASVCSSVVFAGGRRASLHLLRRCMTHEGCGGVQDIKDAAADLQNFFCIRNRIEMSTVTFRNWADL
jgi:hypothetical protein